MYRNIPLLFLLILLSSCRVFHSSHQHPKLIKAKEDLVVTQTSHAPQLNSLKAINITLSLNNSVKIDSQLKRLPLQIVYHDLISKTDKKDYDETEIQLPSSSIDSTKGLTLHKDDPEPEKRKFNSLAIWAFVLSLLGLYFILPFWLVALIFVERADQKFEADPSLKGRGFTAAAVALATIEIMLGSILLVWLFIFLITCSQPDANCP